MSNVGYATLQIIPSAKGFSSKLRTSIGGGLVTEGGKAGEKAGRSFGSSFAKFAVAATAVVGAFRIGKGFLDAAIESQKIAKQTEAVFASMGKEAGGQTLAGIGKLADKLSLLSGIDDEVIQDGANLLLTFGRVRNEVGKGNDIFDRASTAALDMSVALKTDLRSALTQVGKALQDPVKGAAALSKAGSLAKTDLEKLKKMAEAGVPVLEQQKFILEALEMQYGGSAAAGATAGERLQVAWGNVQEQLGGFLVGPAEDLAAWLAEKLPEAMAAFQTWWAATGSPAFEDIKTSVQEDVIPALENLRDWIIVDVIPAFQGFADWLIEHEGMWTDLAISIGAVGTALWLAGGPITGIFALTAAFGLLYQNNETFQEWCDEIVEGWGRIGEAISIVIGLIETAREYLTGGDWGKNTYEEFERRAQNEGASGTLGEIRDGARAMGGSVWAGHTYRINEQGHELFSPGANGTIIPNSALAPADGSAGLSLDIALGVAPGAERDAMSWILKYVRANPGAKRSLAQAVAQ